MVVPLTGMGQTQGRVLWQGCRVGGKDKNLDTVRPCIHTSHRVLLGQYPLLLRRIIPILQGRGIRLRMVRLPATGHLAETQKT